MSPPGSGLSVSREKWGVWISRKQRSDFGWFCLIFKKIIQLILRALLLLKKGKISRWNWRKNKKTNKQNKRLRKNNCEYSPGFIKNEIHLRSCVNRGCVFGTRWVLFSAWFNAHYLTAWSTWFFFSCTIAGPCKPPGMENIKNLFENECSRKKGVTIATEWYSGSCARAKRWGHHSTKRRATLNPCLFWIVSWCICQIFIRFQQKYGTDVELGNFVEYGKRQYHEDQTN